VEGFMRSLGSALALAPDHLSAYCLSLEPGTALTEEVDSGIRERPDNDRAAEMYPRMAERLGGEGYVAYEISNFARPGRESAHNLRYWRREDVIALGPSAHALLANHRWANVATLEGWLSSYSDRHRAPEPKPVPRDEARFEWIFLRLRLREGLSTVSYLAEWGEPFDARYGAIVSRLTGAGLLETVDGWIRLTPDARFLSDGVFAEFAP
jgi:coproporphyrinogen III oxidase-like Fe-S oxidoreductase